MIKTFAMSRRSQIQFQQLIILTLAWQVIAVWISVYDHMVINSELSAGVSDSYSFASNLLLNCGGALMGALMGGSFLVFYVNTRLADKSYGYNILIVLLMIFITMTLVTLVLSYFYAVKVRHVQVGDPGFRSAYLEYALDPLTLKDTLAWATITALTQFVFQMSVKFGHGSLWKIITGKYRRPKGEKRIFMFVDLNSSTSVAERLGETKYHQLLKDFFAHITNPIIDNDGEIYQYVGDEVVVVWSYAKGISDNHCIRCFYAMKKEIEKRSDYYQQAYGLIPTFKAGIHYGNVITGEIGIIKRDITFSGDVLNTASRMLGKCKELNVEMVASSELLHGLPALDHANIRELGSIQLRGKVKNIELSTLISAV
jgi:adenylate cyclase